jgi:hypothetical protein
MLRFKTTTAVWAAAVLLACTGQAGELKDNWNDLLHYTKIGRLDMAKGFAQAILQGQPDPEAMLDLAHQNRPGHLILRRAAENTQDAELAELSQRILDLIERGRFLQRKNPKIIVEEIRRLSTTDRGRLAAVERLKNAGEYAIPYMLDAMADASRKQELPNIIWALNQMERPAIRPLAAALQTENTAVKAEIVKALGEIRYPQAKPYLKYVVENDNSAELASLARESIAMIDPAAMKLPAAELFYQLGESYYYHSESLAPAEDADLADIWFWDAAEKRLVSEKVDKAYFHELMSMRSCEWSLKADPAAGRAIGLWLAAFFKAESAGLAMPAYFGETHADAATYATTAGPEYLHQALARALKDNNAHVALGAVEALIKNAGEKSLMYRLGTRQPLVEALSFGDRAVRYSAAIAIAAAGPGSGFPEITLVAGNLAEAINPDPSEAAAGSGSWGAELAQGYALRAAEVMLESARRRNPVVDLSLAQEALVEATRSPGPRIKVLAARILSHLDSPEAQRAIAAMGLADGSAADIRISAFEALAVSAKINANLLDDASVDALYGIIASEEQPPRLRSAAAAAYGSLNLPSHRVKDLVLDQAKR